MEKWQQNQIDNHKTMIDALKLFVFRTKGINDKHIAESPLHPRMDTVFSLTKHILSNVPFSVGGGKVNDLFSVVIEAEKDVTYASIVFYYLGKIRGEVKRQLELDLDPFFVKVWPNDYGVS